MKYSLVMAFFFIGLDAARSSERAAVSSAVAALPLFGTMCLDAWAVISKAWHSTVEAWWACWITFVPLVGVVVLAGRVAEAWWASAPWFVIITAFWPVPAAMTLFHLIWTFAASAWEWCFRCHRYSRVCAA